MGKIGIIWMTIRIPMMLLTLSGGVGAQMKIHPKLSCMNPSQPRLHVSQVRPHVKTICTKTSTTVCTVLENATSMIDEKEYLVILGGIPQTQQVQVISLNMSDPVPQCLMRIPDHPQIMEWSAFAYGLCKCSCSFKYLVDCIIMKC